MTFQTGPSWKWYAPIVLVPERFCLVAGACGGILFSQGISCAMPSPHHAIGEAGQSPEQDESVRQPFTTLIVEFEAGGTSDSAGTKTLYLDQGNSRWAEYYETSNQSPARPGAQVMLRSVRQVRYETLQALRRTAGGDTAAPLMVVPEAGSPDRSVAVFIAAKSMR